MYEPQRGVDTDMIDRIQATARWKRQRTLENAVAKKIAHRHQALRQALDSLPKEGYSPELALSTARVSSEILDGTLRLGKAHVTQAWPQAGDWPIPPADPTGHTPIWAAEMARAEAEEAPPPLVPQASWAPPLMCLYLPPPLEAATLQQMSHAPPPSYFESRKLRCRLGSGGRMVPTTLPPCARTMPELVRCVAAQLCIAAADVKQLVKLPGTLLADDEDVAYLRDGDELCALLLGGAPPLQELDAAPRAALPLLGRDGAEPRPSEAPPLPPLPVLRLPGPDGCGWTPPMQTAWLDALLSWGWGGWER